MTLKEYAKKYHITYRQAWNRYKQGKIKNAVQSKNGSITIEGEEYEEEVEEKVKKPDYTVIYARVSPNDNKSRMDAQVEKLQKFCKEKGWKVKKVVKEFAGGLNDNRSKLIRILKNKNITRLVIEDKNRLTIFGFNYIKALLDDCEIVIVDERNQYENDQDLVEAFFWLVNYFYTGLKKTRKQKKK